MESYTSLDWSQFWYNTILVLTCLLCLKLVVSKNNSKTSAIVLTIIGAGIVIYFASEPILIYSDKYAYKNAFENIFNASSAKKSSDSGFTVMTRFLKITTDSYFLYFLFIAAVYVFGYIKFIKHFFIKEFHYIVLIATISSLGFYAYGTNTLRQGLALAIFLLALTYHNDKIKYIAFALVAVLIHKSLIIPAVVFWIIKKYNPKNNYIYVWLLCLVLTLIVGNSIAAVLGDTLTESDNRLNNYINAEKTAYKTGFKLNFLLYSIAPIIYGLKIKSKINNDFYNRILSLYIVVNAIWLLVIRIAFTDRFAYLSWFLIPFIFLYPLSLQKLFKNQNAIIALILVYLITVCYIIATK